MELPYPKSFVVAYIGIWSIGYVCIRLNDINIMHIYVSSDHETSIIFLDEEESLQQKISKKVSIIKRYKIDKDKEVPDDFVAFKFNDFVAFKFKQLFFLTWFSYRIFIYYVFVCIYSIFYLTKIIWKKN